MLDTSTVIDSDHEQEELPESRLYIQDVDVSNMIFTYKRCALTVVKSKREIHENHITELAACFNMVLLTDNPTELQVHYLGSSVLAALGEYSHFDRSFSMGYAFSF